MRYLPFGEVKLMSAAELEEREKRFRLYEKYGIPYGVFDGEEEDCFIEADRQMAVYYIVSGQEIPKDLEERLLNSKTQ